MTKDVVDQIRRTHTQARPDATANPAWANCHHDCGLLLAEIERLRAIAERIRDAREHDDWNSLDDAVDDLADTSQEPQGRPVSNSPRSQDEPSAAPPGVMEALKLQASAAAAVDAQAVASSGLFRCVVCGTAMFIGPKQWLCPKCTPQRTTE